MPSVQVICPPNSLLTGSVITAITGAIDRAFREARIGGTLDGHFISLIPTGTYVWFSTTSSLGLWGTDPASHTNNLGTGYRCVLSGNCDAAQVAEQLRYTVSLIPGFTSSRIGATASLSSSNMNYALVTTGNRWTNRGFADLRGLRQRSSTGNNGVTNAIVAQPLAVPGISGSRLRGMRIGRTVAGGAIRAAVYYSQTGASTTDPNGSVLFYDFGQTQGNVTEGYDYVYISGTAPVIPTTGTLWLTFKGNGSQGNNLYMLHGSLTAENCDFPATSSWISDVGSDPTTAFPTTFSAAGTNPFAIVMDAAICFDSPPFAGAGDVEFRYGSHVSASAFGSQIGITGTVQMRGVPPPIQGLRVVSQSIGVGTTHTTQFRLGVYAGGSAIANPQSATLVSDSGQTSGAATSQYLTVAAETGSYLPNTSSILSNIFKNNDATITVLFHASPNTDPDYNPSDWLLNSEYETAPVGSGGTVNSDETVAFPTLFTTGTNDTRPGNLPAMYSILRVDGFQFSQGGADPGGGSLNQSSIFDIYFVDNGTNEFDINLLTSSVSTITLTQTSLSSTFSVGTSVLQSTATLTQNNLSSTFTFGTSLLQSTATLSSTIVSSTFSVGNSSLFVTATLTQNNLSSTFSIGNSTVTVGAVTITQSDLSSTFSLGTSALQSTATLSSVILSSTYLLGISNVTVGAVTITQIDLSSTFSIGNSSLFATATLTQNNLSSTFIVGNASLFTTATLTQNNLSSTFFVGSSNVLSTATLTQGNLSSSYSVGNSVLASVVSLSQNDISSSYFVGNSALNVGAITITLNNPVSTSFSINNSSLFTTATLSSNNISDAYSFINSTVMPMNTFIIPHTTDSFEFTASIYMFHYLQIICFQHLTQSIYQWMSGRQ